MPASSAQPVRAEDGDPVRAVDAIAAYVVQARSAPSEEASREAALRCLLDLLGAAGAGILDDGAAAARRAALATMGQGSSPIWFTGEAGSTLGAAWANSAAAAALDLDDGHRLARGHPGAAVIPAALAVGLETRAPLEAILSAIVIGYEVGVTVASAKTAYGTTGTWAAYAVVAAAAALRGSAPGVIAHALAIAGESSPNQQFLSAPQQSPPPEGSDVKEGIPWSVVTGLSALALAEAGHTGPRNILDCGLFHRLPSPLRLGETQHIRKAYFKLYACCRHVHAPLDALVELLVEHSVVADQIEAIEVQTYGGAMRLPNKVEPSNLVEVQYSIPYCLGLVASAGPDMLLPLTPAALGDAAATRLARRVTLTLEPDFEARFPQETLARLVLSTPSGRFTSRVTAPQGEASSPLSWGDLEAKFLAVTAAAASPAQQRQVLDAVASARLGDLSPMWSCLGSARFSGLDSGRDAARRCARF